MNRRHDIDALRVLAFALLILYHTAMLYVADWGFHIKSPYTTEWLQWPMILVNRWRMDLIFLVSGMAAAFLLGKDSPGRFWLKRSWRLLLPLAFGIAVVVPIQPYAQGVTNGHVVPGFLRFLIDYYSGKHWPKDAFDGWQYGFTWNHLWYLPYLWIYTGLLALMVAPMRSRIGQKLCAMFTRLRGWRLMLLPALPLIVFSVLLQLRFPDSHDVIHDWYRHPMYFTVFLYGYLIARDAGFWAEVLRLRKWTLGTAAVLALAYYSVDTGFPDAVTVPQILRNFYLWTMLLTILGWSHALLNRPFRWLPWATESVYPWYMLHQSLIIGVAYWLIPYKLGPVLEPLLVLVGTVGGCYALSEIVKRVQWLRPCFGLKAVVNRRATPIHAVALRDDLA